MKKCLFTTTFALIFLHVVQAQWYPQGTSPSIFPYYVGTNGVNSGIGTNQPLYFGINSKESGYITDSTRLTGYGVGSLNKLSQTFPPVLNLAIPFSVAGFILTLIAGFLGWALVQKYHVGVDAFTEDEKIIASQRP